VHTAVLGHQTARRPRGCPHGSRMPCRFPWTATVGSVQMVDEIDELVLGRTRDRRSGRSTTRFCTTLSISWAPRHHCVDLAAGTARQDKEVIVTRPGYSCG